MQVLAGRHGHVEIGDLPESIPIFPLSGAMLLPAGRLPLNVFEPRYLAMVRDALGAERMIGMIQPLEQETESQNPPLYKVGCLGKIMSFTETDDGHFLITLTGLCRFRRGEELARITPYRKLVVSYEDFAGDLAPPLADSARPERAQLIPRLKIFLESQGMRADWPAIETAPDEVLINAFSMISTFPPNEKQALLEAPSLVERAHALMALIEMALSSRDDDEEPQVQ